MKLLASIYRREDLNYTLGKESKLEGPQDISKEIASLVYGKGVIQLARV
jgi:hypothetical protein